MEAPGLAIWRNCAVARKDPKIPAPTVLRAAPNSRRVIRVLLIRNSLSLPTEMHAARNRISARLPLVGCEQKESDEIAGTMWVEYGRLTISILPTGLNVFRKPRDLQ